MKSIKTLIGILPIIIIALLCSCETDNINPEDCVKNTIDTLYIGDSSTKMSTDYAKYPQGSIVWTKDTILSSSFKVPVGKNLYIEPGVTVTASSNSDPKVEIVVLGNMYCMGTSDKPVTFTTDSKKLESWGGIICGYESKEVVLDHTIVEYAGATPTESSLSYQNQLFKTEIDGGVPAFHFCNVNGKFVIFNSIFRNIYNDATYFTGGQCIIANSSFTDCGNSADGGEAINFKSGCKADIANNLIYNACTNGFKLSNSGTSEIVPTSVLTIYNNTLVNCGWRRAKNKKGGAIWVEKGISPILSHNMIYDCRFGTKQPDTDGCDVANSILTPNYYFASTVVGVEQMNAKLTKGVINYDTDIYSQSAGENDPLFVSFVQTPKIDINCQTDDQSAGAPLTYDPAWDFHLQKGSQALTGIVPTISLNWVSGLVFTGLKSIDYIDPINERGYFYYSPVPANYYGAFGQK